MNVEILLETPDYLVINKPAGLVVHGDSRTNRATLVDWILEHYPEMKGVGEPATFDDTEIDRPGIVHRLDEETSGVLIVAKTSTAFAHFKAQFMDRAVHKEYHAFVWGHFKESAGIVDAPIGRSGGDFRKKLAGRGVRGATKEAVTRWQAINQFEEAGERFAFLHLFPETGRTHQLRVHMKYLQRPIVSDTLYGGKPALGFLRLALHARTITFLDLENKEISVTAPYPEDFKTAVAKYGQS